jgi:type VI secretion system FHA domain protein
VVLTVEVNAPEGAKPVMPGRYTFSEAGGTIGRASNNSWVLPHGSVSAHHAVISWQNSIFYIKDTSTNGICVNSPDNRLVRGRAYPLKSGDHILIEPYEIRASISESESAYDEPASSFPWRSDEPHPIDDDPLRRSEALSSIMPDLDDVSGQELDPLEFLPASRKGGQTRKPVTAENLEEASVLDHHVELPVAVPGPRPKPQVFHNPAVNDDQAGDRTPDSDASIPPPAPILDRLSSSLEEMGRAPLPAYPTPLQSDSEKSAAASPAVRSGGSAASSAIDLGEMLEAAGLKGADITPELARRFGEILRVVVCGVMDVLQARQQVKEEFRIRLTRFRAVGNNPLKFSANVEDALHNLLVKRNAAYLGPVEAFADAFADLRHHELAVLAGMRAAFDSMVAEFHPDRLQEDFDSQLSKGQLFNVPVPARIRYWELYREMHDKMAKDPDDSFRSLFGEAFAEAYEAQLERLKRKAGGQ